MIKRRNAFTLVEMILAVFIFGYMSASMATIYSTTNRHMFQNYRRNIVKTSTLVSMRAIQNNLALATRIDWPNRTAPNDRLNTLAFATNIDQLTGCYPVNPFQPVHWHYFCLGNDPLIAGSRNLYYHTNTTALAAGPACSNFPSPCPTCWTPTSYPVPTCGAAAAGQTVTLLMRHVVPLPATSGGFLFSRRGADGAAPVGAVRVALRSFWQANPRGFGTSQRDVDFTLDTVLSVSRHGP